MKTMTRTEESTAMATTVVPTVLLAFELGERVWQLGFTTGLGQRPRIRQIPARAVGRVLDEIRRAKVHFHLPATAPVVSCYEAGREAFWLHRWLLAHAGSHHVIDSSSIEVNRRARRAKSDRLDLAGLLNLLARYQQGDRRGWRVVRVPSVAEEDGRHLHRTRETIQQERTRVINRLRALLTLTGMHKKVARDDLQRRISTRRLRSLQLGRPDDDRNEEQDASGHESVTHGRNATPVGGLVAKTPFWRPISGQKSFSPSRLIYPQEPTDFGPDDQVGLLLLRTPSG